MDFNVDEFIEGLSEGQMSRFVQRLFPAIFKKMSFRSESSAVGDTMPGFPGQPLDFTSKEGEYTVKHKFGKEPQGAIHVNGESVRIIKMTATDITFKSVTGDVKNRVVLF